MHNYPKNNAAMWTVAGISRLRQEERMAAREAFLQGLAEVNGLLKKSGQNPSAMDTKKRPVKSKKNVTWPRIEPAPTFEM